MTIKETALDLGLKPIAALGANYYPNQKDLLDKLRSRDRYAIVVFDALRYDYARSILPLYLRGEIMPIWSAAHDTFQYGKRCWGDRVHETTYVSGAVPINSEKEFEDDHFQSLYQGFSPPAHLPNLVNAWREAWDKSLGTVNPDSLTDLALEYTDRDKLAVHYFQPHAPYIGRASILGHTGTGDGQPFKGEPVDKPLWDRVKSGEISTGELERAYRSNIHRGVEAALPLIRALCEQDRKVIVMADHGELLGTYHPRLVSHPRFSFPQIRRVPWMEVEGVRDYPDGGRERSDESVEDKLEALGYL